MFCFYCRDGEHGARLRELYRDEHWEYIATCEGDYTVAGLLKGKDGQTVGSMLLVQAENEQAARTIFEGDPFFTGGVWQSVRLDRFDPLFGTWLEKE